MNGAGRRYKGAEGERQLCRQLLQQGYDARRVIRTRAVAGYEADIVPDVTAEKDGVETTIEVKLRGGQFKTIYDMLGNSSTTFRVTVDGVAIAFGTNFTEVRNCQNEYFPLVMGSVAKTHRYILRLRRWLKGAQVLAIRANRKPFLFIRYWG